MEHPQVLIVVLSKKFYSICKKNSKRTQRRRSKLDRQIAARNYEKYLIDNSLHYMRTINLDDDPSESQPYTKSPIITGSRGRLKFKIKDGKQKVFYKKNRPRLNEETLNFGK